MAHRHSAFEPMPRKMVRADGYAPPPPVCKTGTLLLRQARMKLVPTAGFAPAPSPRSRHGASAGWATWASIFWRAALQAASHVRRGGSQTRSPHCVAPKIMEPATGLVARMIRFTRAARLSATLAVETGHPSGDCTRHKPFCRRLGSLAPSGALGGPMGLAPTPRLSQSRMLLLHHGPRLAPSARSWILDLRSWRHVAWWAPILSEPPSRAKHPKSNIQDPKHGSATRS